MNKLERIFESIIGEATIVCHADVRYAHTARRVRYTVLNEHMYILYMENFIFHGGRRLPGIIYVDVHSDILEGSIHFEDVYFAVFREFGKLREIVPGLRNQLLTQWMSSTHLHSPVLLDQANGMLHLNKQL